MANEIREANPMLSPDSVRATMNFLHAFNETHTKRFNGYEDTDGSKYIGTSENFGNEILLESRKLLLDRPSLKKIFDENTFSDYFDIGFSELIEHPEQQNMMVALLKENVFLANKTYQLRFDNCSLEKFIRAESYGIYSSIDDPKVKYDEFYVTTTEPTLVVTSTLDPSDIDEIPLSLVFGESETKYMWHKCLSTDIHVESISETSSEIFSVLVNLEANWKNLPFAWIVIDGFQYRKNVIPESEGFDPVGYTGRLDLLPHINNIYHQMVPDLMIGVDGNCWDHLYIKTVPYTEIPEYDLIANHPPGEDIQVNVYAIASFDDFDENNMAEGYKTTEIDKYAIVLMYRDDASQQLFYYLGYEIFTYNKDEMKLYLNFDFKDISHTTPAWTFKRMEAGDAGVFAPEEGYIYCAQITPSIWNADPIPIFNMSPDTTGSVLDRGKIDAVSGIHVDTGTDYTTNAVVKDTGVIHNLDKFDGLPDYFGKLMDRNLHRSHVEMYAIRDRINDPNQRTIDKQTAGLILDSGLPITEVAKPDSSIPIIIYYDIASGKFKSRTNLVEDERNCASEITFEDVNHFSNSSIPNKGHLDKFIYHGHRHFSLGMAQFDADKEYARVYAVTNDPIKYINNGTDFNKPLRTLARICDIPTSFDQLIHVQNTAPTLIFDSAYTHTDASFTYETADMLWNECDLGPAYVNTSRAIGFDSLYILPFNSAGPRVWYHSEDIFEKYGKWDNFDAKVDLNEGSFEVISMGSGYTVGDKFYILIGGVAIDGTVTAISSGATSGATQVQMNLTNVPLIDPFNIHAPFSGWNTYTRTGDGSGLKLLLEFTDEYWDSLNRVETEELHQVRTYMYDEIGNIWLWTYNGDEWVKEVQVTGAPVKDNPYDEEERRRRDLNSSMLYNNIVSKNIIDDECLENRFEYRHPDTFEVTYEDIYDETIDISDKLKEYHEVGLVAAVRPDPVDNTKGVVYTFTANKPYQRKNGDEKPTNEFLLPRYNELNVSHIYNSSNKFMLPERINTKQPNLYLFFPNHVNKTKDPLTNYDLDPTMKCVAKNGEYTYADILYPNPEDVDIEWISSDNSTISNLYHYNEFGIPTAYDELADLKVETKEKLISYCTEAFNLSYDDAVKMSRSELFSYAITHEYMKRGSIYKRDDIKMEHAVGTKVLSNPVSSLTTGVPPQLIGDYLMLNQQEVDINVSIDGIDGFDPPIYIFEYEPETSETGIPDNMRVYDIEGTDITDVSMLIKVIDRETHNTYEKYIFRNNKWILLI